MGTRPKGACRRPAPGVMRRCKPWQRHGAAWPRKCAAHFSISNKPTASSRVKQKHVQTADEALDMARGNFAAGLGTQLDVLQAAADVTRTRTTRLSAIYLHNVALARLTHACASSAEALNFGSDFKDVKNETRNAAHAADVAKPPEKMTQR